MYAKKLIKKEVNNVWIIEKVIKLLEKKDEITKNHSLQVAWYAKRFGEKLNDSMDNIEELYQAGIVHDIGKINIEDKILLKNDKLTQREYEVMKNHSIRGYEIFKKMKGPKQLLPYILYHHERVDGEGYAFGLLKEEIPYKVKMLSICDAYEAMTGERPYKKALSKKDAIERLQEGQNTQFDKELVDLFIKKCL
ncbi:HD-GYP domain-containing protein [Anaerophilus nitritogenes]|uniref:HD-GYP domain-containing protein n=1 Tax=Anaerophilus nitritogenes TaxID=2498136 RepID=UPI00101CB721|nr:HD domain-containing phosphohydrolase [Anaerophilus nitritogenes]